MRVDIDNLVSHAKQARKNAYAPYSNFSVGAAVLACDRIYHGCNVENASYGLTMCAERVAIFKAVSDGCRSVDAVAIYAEPKAYPCGACLQVMAEFCSEDCKVIVAGKNVVEVYALSELLPHIFSKDTF